MTKVSKYPLDSNLLSSINLEFIQFLNYTSTLGALSDFLHDFLTPTEFTMLSKRLMIAILLKRGYNAESIKNRLSVSNSAIIGVNGWLRNPRAGTLKTFIDHDLHKDIQAFIDKIEELFDKLPPGKYQNWKIVGKEKFARKKSRILKSRLR